MSVPHVSPRVTRCPPRVPGCVHVSARVRVRLDVLDSDLLGLDELADVQLAPRDVLGGRVRDGVVREADGPLSCAGGCRKLGKAEM